MTLVADGFKLIEGAALDKLTSICFTDLLNDCILRRNSMDNSTRATFKYSNGVIYTETEGRGLNMLIK